MIIRQFLPCQYDLEFEFEGDLKTFTDGLKSFTSSITSVADELNRIIKAIDFNITCEQIYSAFATGSAAAIAISIIPGIVKQILKSF